MDRIRASAVTASATLNPMINDGLKRVCFTLRVRRDRLDEYRRRHQSVWPEMLQALRNAGWRNYSLFLSDDGLLIGYLETHNFEQALARMAATDVNRRWQAEMATFFDCGSKNADEAMFPIPEMFHLD